MEITINKHFGRYNPGDKVNITSKNGVPLDRYWRRKLKDAETNDCIAVKVPSKPLTKSSKKGSDEK